MKSTEQKMTRRVYVLRWVAVFPGSLLCLLLVMFPIHWFVMLQYTDTPDYDASDLEALINPQSLELLMNAFFTPFIFITAGSNIAPKFKFPTGIGLAIVFGVFYVVAASVVVGEIREGLYTPVRWLRLGITILLCIAGVAIGLLQARKAGRQATSWAS